jgi:hypothetical protein
MMSTVDNPIGAALTMLGSFEEELAALYQALAVVDTPFADFWNSGSMAKASRANLYARLHQDLTQNPDQYCLEKGPTGPFMNYFNKVRSSRECLKVEQADVHRHMLFLLEVESSLCGNPAFPSIQGKTEYCHRVMIILDKIQRSQIQIVRGLVKTSPSFR